MPGEPARPGDLHEHDKNHPINMQEFTKPPPRRNQKQQKRKLLHTCGISFFSIARYSYQILENIDGPIGSLARRTSAAAAPLVDPIRYVLLSLLSFADDRIVAPIEDTATFAFSASVDLFDKLGHASETLPGKFHEVINDLPAIASRLPVLGWAVCLLASLLDERVIGMDVSCIHVEVVEDLGEVEGEMKEKVMEEEEEERQQEEEKEKQEQEQEQEVDGDGKEREECEMEEKKVVMVNEILILDLFDEGWHTMPKRRK